ncbi:MAG: hypothetical protein ACLPRE_04355 [Limisphaerales bacterium]
MSRRLKILIAVAIAFGVVILIPIIHHYQLRAATEAYIAQLKAQGEPMDLAQVIPPPVPPEENGVPFIINSLTNLKDKYKSIVETNPPMAMREVSPGKAMVSWQQPNIVGFDDDDLASLSTNARLWTNNWEDLERELAAEKDGLDSFQSLSNHPVLDFNLDYGKGYLIRLENLAPLAHASRWLSTAAVYDLHEGKTAEACADAHAILMIVKGQTEERLEISQQTRDAIASIGAETTWEILQEAKVSESELASLQQDWESVEFVGAAKRAFLAERVINLHSMEHYLQSPSDLWRGVNGNDKDISRRLCKHLWQWFWAYADEKRMMQTYQVLIDATRMAETNHSFQSAQKFARTNFIRLGFEMPFPQEGTFRMDIDPIGVRWLLSEDAFDSFRLLKRALVFETARNMTIVAIALKRYELQHHELPPTLDSLTPAILKTIPLDYMNGQALHYQKNPDGIFLLYSVGENGVDDGGNPAQPSNDNDFPDYDWNDSHALDWVWPQPATEAEIQNYYAHPPK